MKRALCAAALLVACSSSGDGVYDYASSKGAALYQDQCQVCHGETGEGGLGPALRDSKRSQGDLANIIAMRMPLISFVSLARSSVGAIKISLGRR